MLRLTSLRFSHVAILLAVILGIVGMRPAAPVIAETGKLIQKETSLGTVPETVGDYQIELSPDGRRLAAIVRRRGVMKQSMMSQLTFGAWKQNPARILIDGEIGPEFQGACCLTFSPDGSRLAYVVYLPPGEEPEGVRPKFKPKKMGPIQVVIDGETGPLLARLLEDSFARPIPAPPDGVGAPRSCVRNALSKAKAGRAGPAVRVLALDLLGLAHYGPLT